MAESTSTAIAVKGCQAVTKKGNVCNQPVVAGFPFCYNHISSGSMIVKTHDRYSSAMPEHLGEHYQHQLLDDNVRDITEEIAGLRALLRYWLNKVRNSVDANGQPSPLSPDDVVIITNLNEKVTRLVETYSKINPERVVTVPDVLAIITRIMDIINEKIPQDRVDIRAEIVEGIKRATAELLTTSTEHTFGSET